MRSCFYFVTAVSKICKMEIAKLFFSVLLLLSAVYIFTDGAYVKSRRKSRYWNELATSESDRTGTSRRTHGRAAKRKTTTTTKSPLEHDQETPNAPPCDTVFNVPDKEKVVFELSQTRCKYGFMGSRREKCKAEIVCTEMFFEPGDCESGKYFQLTDGLQGLQKSCAPETFTKPYRASNKGTDLFVEYYGPISATCTVSCFEDRKNKKVPRTFLTKATERTFENSCVCGEKLTGSTRGASKKGRVVGGTDAVPFEFPWQASIVHPGTRKSFCGGSLINNEYILTAAHCVQDSTPGDLEVLLHSHVMDLSTNELYQKNAKAGERGSVVEVKGLNLPPTSDADEESIRLKVKKIILPTGLYDPITKDYDVALLQLETLVNLKLKTIRPICLPSETDQFDISDKNTTVAGWGRPFSEAGAGNRILQKLDIQMFLNRRCRRFMGENITPRMICGGYLEGGKDSCNVRGDSGGPVVYKFNEHQYRQVGIVSFGIGCAARALPGVYTNVQEVTQWIYSNTPTATWCKDKKSGLKSKTSIGVGTLIGHIPDLEPETETESSV